MEDKLPKSKIISIGKTESAIEPEMPEEFFDAVDYVIDQAGLDFNNLPPDQKSNHQQDSTAQSDGLGRQDISSN